MRLRDRIRWWLVKHIVIPKLVTDRALTPTQIQIFRLYYDLDEYDTGSDWRYRKLTTYLMHRALPVYILTSLMGRSVEVRDKIDLINLKTVIGNSFYKDYFMSNINSGWIREKWYNKKKLPIVARIGGVNYVVDGNHRLAQQIIRNEVQYNYIVVEGNWFNLYLRHCIGY